MRYPETFQVPNMVVDRYFPILTGAEITVLIVIIRQTHGWVDQRTGKRKTRDWISHSQFMKKTGLSRRAISATIQSLVVKSLISVTDLYGNLITIRQGQPKIFYSPNMCTLGQGLVQFFPKSCAESAHNKTNYTKINETKLRNEYGRSYRVVSIGDVIKSSGYEKK